MSHKMIMDFRITVQPDLISEVECPTGKAKIIPFDGWVKSELFTGKLLPGAADVQFTNPGGIRHMCAQYMFEGTDRDGRPCRLFVSNNGYFEPGRTPKPFHTCPTFLTDSAVLGEYLHQARFRTEGKTEEDGLHIRVYDVLSQE